MARDKEAKRKYHIEWIKKNREKVNESNRLAYAKKVQHIKSKRANEEATIHPLLVSDGCKKRRGVVLNCDFCQADIYKRQSTIRDFNFCGKVCHDKYQSKPGDRVCVVCSKTFFCVDSQIKLRNRKTCSMDCRNKLKTIEAEKRAAENPNHLKDPDRSARYSKKMDEWRKKVFERDNYTCQKCNARNGNGVSVYLEAHHVKQFALYPEIRYEVSNGLTLCKPCHKQEDHIIAVKSKIKRGLIKCQP
jgi:hypothetical protein